MMVETVGRIRVSLKAETPAEPEPRREEIPRVVRLLALSHKWHREIDTREIESQTEIARRTGLTAARVSQILGLRWLCPVVQEWMMAEDDAVGAEKEWRVVAANSMWIKHVDATYNEPKIE
jgi:hypothetical protein